MDQSESGNILREKWVDLNSTREGSSNPSNISSLLEVVKKNAKIQKKLRKVSFDKENQKMAFEECCSIQGSNNELEQMGSKVDQIRVRTTGSIVKEISLVDISAKQFRSLRNLIGEKEENKKVENELKSFQSSIALQKTQQKT